MADKTPPTPSPRPSLARRCVRAGLTYLVGPYVAVLLLATTFQRALIYHPGRDESLNARSSSSASLAIEPLAVKSEDAVELHGWHVARPSEAVDPDGLSDRANGRPVFLYFCGNAGNRAHRLEDFKILTNLGADVVCFDYRGYGDNAGSPAEALLAADAHAIWDFLVGQLGLDPARLVIFGESLGGGVATRLAAELSARGTPAAGLILRSTFNRLTDAAAFHFPWLPVHWLMIDRFPSQDRIGQVVCPILILHGKRDTVVPFELGNQLFAAAPEQSATGIAKRLIPLETADHNDVLFAEPETFRRGVAEFLVAIARHAGR